MNSPAFFRARWAQILATIMGVWLTPASSRAQFTYSVNAVGYVDANFVAGSNLISNPLFAGDNTLASLFKNVPDGTVFLPWDQAAKTFRPTNRFTFGSGWSDPSAVFLAPNGGFLWLPTATKISFAGQPWSIIPGPCLNYPAGESVFSWFSPFRCFSDCACNEYFQDGDALITWNRETQTYRQPATYTQGNGWEPFTVLDVTESAHFITGRAFNANGPFKASFLGGPIPQGLPLLDLRNPVRSGDNLTFNWLSTSNVNYAVFCSTNLNTGVWQLVQQGTVTPSNGVASVSVPGTNSGAYYRVLPQFGASVVLLGGTRGASTFTFQLYAPVATNYIIERTENGDGGPAPWQFVTNVTAGPSNIVSVVVTTPTASKGYYRALHF
jgi:hypothetical protein